MNYRQYFLKAGLWLLALTAPLMAQAEGSLDSTPGRPGKKIDRGCYPPTAACPFDLNCDGKVNDSDVGILLNLWGKPSIADFNEDSTVDGSDLGMQLGAWGLCPKIDTKLRRATLYRQCTKKISSVRHSRKKVASTLSAPACKAYRK